MSYIMDIGLHSHMEQIIKQQNLPITPTQWYD